MQQVASQEEQQAVHPSVAMVGKQALHSSHEIRQMQGIIYCLQCGCYAQFQTKTLHKKCQGAAKRTKKGKENLVKIGLGKPPGNLQKWPVQKVLALPGGKLRTVIASLCSADGTAKPTAG